MTETENPITFTPSLAPHASGGVGEAGLGGGGVMTKAKGQQQ